MDPAIGAQPQELFNPEISQLEQMLDWDLRHWH
jgi:hypothetical protein